MGGAPAEFALRAVWGDTGCVARALRVQWLLDARISASLGYRLRDRLRLGAYHLGIAFARALRLPPPSHVVVKLAPDGHEVTIGDPGELAVLHDILVHEEYRPSGDPKVIFDIGANVGFATLYFRRRFPEARIITVEADPRTYQRMARNLEGLADVTPLNLALAGVDDLVTFHSAATSIGSSLARRSDADTAVTVPGRRLQTLMEETRTTRIDLLKLDIEGAEFEALAGAPLERVSELIAEIHHDLGGGDEQTVRELLDGFELKIEPGPSPIVTSSTPAGPASGGKERRA